MSNIEKIFTISLFAIVCPFTIPILVTLLDDGEDDDGEEVKNE